MARTKHKILSRYAFSADPSNPAELLAEKMDAFFDQYETDRKANAARLEALEAASRNPEAQAKAGMNAGLRSGRGTEESMKADNDRLKKSLASPAFAAAYFLAQRTTFTARKREFCGLPQRRLS